MSLLIELLQRDPYHLEGLNALGETLYEAGRPADAAVAFARVLRFDPDNAGALYFQGVLRAAQHRFRDAIVLWQRVLDLEPAGEYARRARRDMRTAADLEHIFGRGRELPGAVAAPPAPASMPFGAAGPVTRHRVELHAGAVRSA
jgi:tetratricopeptide (TPR) repeat protein